LEGYHTQGKALDQALKDIREVIDFILEEEDKRELVHMYHPREMSPHTITV